MSKRNVVTSQSLAVILSLAVHVASSSLRAPASLSTPDRLWSKPKGLQTASQSNIALEAATTVINEYLADPPDGAGGDANGDGTRDATQDEFVEIVNAGSTPLNVSAFTISDSILPRFIFPSGKVIPPGEAAVVFGGGKPTGAFGNAGANGLVFAVGGAGLSLNNGGDSIIVKDNLGTIVASLSFGATEGSANQSITRSPDVSGGFVRHSLAPGSAGALFSPGARVNGRPLVSPDPVITSISPDSTIAGAGEINLTVSGDKFQEGAQVRIEGTPIRTSFLSPSQLSADIPAALTKAPGVRAVTVENPDARLSNSVSFTVLGEIGINEYLADPPDGMAGDANGDGSRDSSQDEFVEIVNRTGEPFDVGGYSIGDATQARFTFPPNTAIPPQESAVIFGGGSPRGEFGNAGPNGLVFTASLSLNNTGDTIILRDNTGNTIESITYGAAEGNANQSLNRNPDALGTGFVTHSSLTGSGGRLFSPGARSNGAPFTAGPRITRVTPDRVVRSNASFDISVGGTGFDTGSTVLIDFAPVATTVRGAAEILAVVPARVAGSTGEHSVAVLNEGGNRSNVVTLTVVPAQPSLTLVLPRFIDVGSPAFTLFVFGTNFEAASAVLVDGTAIPAVLAAPGELRATVNGSFAAALGDRRVRVRNPDGQLSNELAFTVVPPRPRITTLLPNQVAVGAPGFSLKLTGVNFKSGAAVLFDQTAVATSFISAMELRADVPGSLITKPGLRAVTVQNSDGATSDEAIFRILPIAPVIHSIEPESVIEGSGDLTVTIIGAKFQNGAVVRVVEELRLGLELATSFLNAERLEAKLPAVFAKTAGRVMLRVENPDSGVSNSIALEVLIKDVLVINEFLADPPEGPPGDANGDGNRSSTEDEFIEVVNRASSPIDVSGYKLSDSESVRHVFAGGTIIPPHEAAVVFGGGTPTGAFGNAAQNKLVFTASSGGLSLSNGGDLIKLEDGSGRVVQQIKYSVMEGSANQSINRDPDVDGATFSPHTRIVPGSFRLFSPGVRAAGEPFTIKPALGALSPAGIRAGAAAFSLTVTGSNFQPGAMVLFGETLLETARRSDLELEAHVNAASVAEGGAADVRVRNPRGEVSGALSFYIIEDPPQITSIAPLKTGTGAENLEISVAGERLQRGATVLIAGEAVESNALSRASIAAILPAKFFLRAAELEVRVLNADGNLSNVASLTVENGPLITRLSRSHIKRGRGEIEMTFGGIAFKPGVILFVNETSVQTRFLSETELTAHIPGELAANSGTLILQARNPDGGRSNKVTLKVVE